MAVIGTAGHVDHGKSTLVLALTGRDPDRWKEEKERGLTIDLGFAWMPAGGDRQVSFVDVPGHERFIKNMLAGIEMIDGAILVVAADEGWMPQSEEHLAVLDLLGTERAIVAITKTDLVDPDLLELAILEIDEKLTGTALGGAPLIPVSARSGDGLDRLRTALVGLVDAIEADRQEGSPRLWVDRSFSISGAGTVATGTLTGGSLRVGEELEAWPSGERGRIRTLHRHETQQTSVAPGSRCAVNLAGLERTALERGSLLAPPGELVATDSWLSTITTARYVEAPLTSRGAYHVHLGSGAWPASLRPLDDAGLTGRGLALVRPEVPIPVRVGDRFILREVGRREVVAGGRVLDPAAPVKRSENQPFAERLESILHLEPDAAATLLLDVKRTEDPERLRTWTGGRPETGIVTPDLAVAADHANVLGRQATELVEKFHAASPLRPGYPKASLASQLGIDGVVLQAIIDQTDDLRDDGSTVARRTFRAGLTPEQESRWAELRSTLSEAGAAVPRLRELDVPPELLHVLLRERRLVRISEDFVYLPEQLDRIVEGAASLPASFTVSEFREALGLSRKYAVPILEYLDGQGITRRHGDSRSLRQ